MMVTHRLNARECVRPCAGNPRADFSPTDFKNVWHVLPSTCDRVRIIATMKSFKVLAALVCSVSAFASGCCTMQPIGPCGGCGTGGQLLGICGVQPDDCGSCETTTCGSGLACGSGCGDVYYGERINTPAVCDPCDSMGGYTGGSCGPCGTQLPILNRLARLFALSPNSACGGCGLDDCSSCSGGVDMGGHSSGGGCQSCAGGETTHFQPASESQGQSLMVVPKKDEPIAPVPDSNASNARPTKTQARWASTTSNRISPAKQKQLGGR